MNAIRLIHCPVVVCLCLFALHAAAQTPHLLRNSIPPPTGAQISVQLGFSVAVDGGYTVVGAPFDDTQVNDSGLVKVFDSASGALLYVLPNPTPAGNDQFGYSVAVSGNRVVVGARRDDALATDAGAVYVFDLASATPTVPATTLNNPTATADDFFGHSVAISGSRVVVGSPFDDTGASAAGRAYVYDLGTATPSVPLHTLNNPGPAAADQFGWSVAISGTRVVVGAFADDTGAVDAGSAYVYSISSGTPTVPVNTLNNPGPAVNDQFGAAVAISGTRVVVGASLDDTGASDSGSTYVYDVAGGTPTVPVATLNNPAPAAADRFGWSVAISGTRVVTGAYLDDAGAINAGSAYYYDIAGATPLVPVLTLNNPAPAGDDQFGQSVAITGTRIVVGADLDDTLAFNAGSAYAFDVTSGTPTVPAATLNSPSPSFGDQFGRLVSLSGTRLAVSGLTGSVWVHDLAGANPSVPAFTLNNPVLAGTDGFGNSIAISGTLVVVGASQNNTGAAGSGIVYVYDLSSGTPAVPAFTLVNPAPAASDNFGFSVAVSGPRIVVGANLDNAGATDAGSAYVFDVSSGTPTVPVATLPNPGPAVNDQFGYSVAISGTRVAVGSHLDDTGATDAGSAYVFDIAGGTPTVPVATLNNPAPLLSDNFGNSVAISGTRVVVGASLDNAGATDSGSAYVYDVSSGTPTVPVATLANPGPTVNDQFGNSVAISGTRIVVGANGDDTGATDSGTTYVYDLASTTPTVPIFTLNNPGPATTDRFGSWVAVDVTTIAIGAPLDDTIIADKGAVYVFSPTDTGTVAPVLTAPASSTLFTSAVSVAFSLPEAAGPGTVKLTFTGPATRELTLASSQESIGAHGFSFSSLTPLAAPEVAAGTAIPDGIYTVTLSCRDAALNPAASSLASTGVVIDTTAPTVAAPVGGFAPLALVAPAPLPSYIGQAVTFDALGVTGVSQVPAPGTATTAGPNNVTLLGTDAAGHTGSLSFNVQGLTFSQDADSDGLNDASELQMAALGFNWQLAQPALVSALFSNANGAGLFTPAQVGTLNAGVSLISRNQATGQFTVRIGLEKSTNLSTFSLLPMTAPQTTINGSGELEFTFGTPDNAAFFRLETR